MMTTEQIEELEELEPVEESTGEEPEGQEEQQVDAPEPPDPEIEREARKYGWRPKEEYTRDPEGWVDAKRFMELPSTHNKMLRDEIKENSRAFQERLDRIEAVNKVAMERAIKQERERYEESLRQLEQQKLEAVRNADDTEYQRLARQEEQMRKSAPEPVAAPQPQQQAADPWVISYRDTEDGKWLNNPILIREAAEVIDQMPGRETASAKAQVEYAERIMREAGRLPSKPKPQTRQMVDVGGLATGRKGKGANALPPEARQYAKEFVEMGVFKSVEEYAEEYFKQEGK